MAQAKSEVSIKIHKEKSAASSAGAPSADFARFTILLIMSVFFSFSFLLHIDMFSTKASKFQTKENDQNNFELVLERKMRQPVEFSLFDFSNDKKIKKIVNLKTKKMIEALKNESLLSELTSFYIRGERKYSIVLSKWRSGSSFFGDLLQSVPGSFYTYEPLINEKGILRPPIDMIMIERLKQTLKCEFSESSQYLKFLRKWVNILMNMAQLAEVYKEDSELASSAKFVTETCKAMPFQCSKVIKLGLESFRSMLEHNELNVKVVLLVRDPRAVMNSRKNIAWCGTMIDCMHPSVLCGDMERDYYAAKDFLSKFPANVR